MGQFLRSAMLSRAAATSAPPAGSREMTSTVSSPATVPRIEDQAAWSMAEARNCAAPAGVRSTTRFALGSALSRNSAAMRASRPGGSRSGAPRA